jgi:hypothetical protein
MVALVIQPIVSGFASGAAGKHIVGVGGLCIGYDSGDAVLSEYTPKFDFTGGNIEKSS